MPATVPGSPPDPVAQVAAEFDLALPPGAPAEQVAERVLREETAARLAEDHAAWAEARLARMGMAANVLGAIGALLGFALLVLVLELAGARPIAELREAFGRWRSP